MHKRLQRNRYQAQSPKDTKPIKAKDPSRESTEIAQPYEPTPAERAALEAVRGKEKAPRVKITQTKSKATLA